MLNFQGTVYIRNGITYSLPFIGGSIFLVNPGSILIINQQLVINHKDLVLLNGSTDEILTVPVMYEDENREATTNIVAEWMKDIKGMVKKIHSKSRDSEISA